MAGGRGVDKFTLTSNRHSFNFSCNSGQFSIYQIVITSCPLLHWSRSLP